MLKRVKKQISFKIQSTDHQECQEYFIKYIKRLKLTRILLSSKLLQLFFVNERLMYIIQCIMLKHYLLLFVRILLEYHVIVVKPG